MTINTQRLRERIDAAIKRIKSGSAPMRVPADQTDPDLVLADAKIALDTQAAEIARLRGLVAEMAELGTYETEYDGRMYSICHGCGAQDGESHRDPYCVYVRAEAATIRSLLADYDRLREALSGVLVDDLLPCLPAEYVAKVRAALAQEQGESDGKGV